jgi:CheY-like chemotaxis protein
MSLRGIRLLLVEDESLVAMLVEDLLAELGCEVVASPASVKDALPAVEAGGFDVALLDVNIAGEHVEPVAEALAARGIPVVFASGYGRHGVPSRYAAAPMLAKPFDIHELAQALSASLQGHRATRMA